VVSTVQPHHPPRESLPYVYRVIAYKNSYFSYQTQNRVRLLVDLEKSVKEIKSGR